MTNEEKQKYRKKYENITDEQKQKRITKKEITKKNIIKNIRQKKKSYKNNSSHHNYKRV